MTTETRIFQRDDTVPIWAETRNSAGVPFNPTPDGIKVTLMEPDGTLAKDADGDDITGEPMTQTSTGKFVYYYTSGATDPTGWWRYSCKAVDGTDTEAKTVITRGGFALE